MQRIDTNMLPADYTRVFRKMERQGPRSLSAEERETLEQGACESTGFRADGSITPWESQEAAETADSPPDPD